MSLDPLVTRCHGTRGTAERRGEE